MAEFPTLRCLNWIEIEESAKFYKILFNISFFCIHLPPIKQYCLNFNFLITMKKVFMSMAVVAMFAMAAACNNAPKAAEEAAEEAVEACEACDSCACCEQCDSCACCEAAEAAEVAE